jgi:hypothetical protein
VARLDRRRHRRRSRRRRLSYGQRMAAVTTARAIFNAHRPPSRARVPTRMPAVTGNHGYATRPHQTRSSPISGLAATSVRPPARRPTRRTWFLPTAGQTSLFPASCSQQGTASRALPCADSEHGAAERSRAELYGLGASQTPGSCKHQSSSRTADNRAAHIGQRQQQESIFGVRWPFPAETHCRPTSHVLASVTQSHAAAAAAISRGGRPRAR